MRICYIADGSSIHTRRWVNYFARKGHEVHLISNRFPPKYEGLDEKIDMHPLLDLFPHFGRLSRYLSAVTWPRQVRKLVREIRPEILDAHFITVYGYLGALSDFHPLILTAWGSDILLAPKRNYVHKVLTERALHRTDRVICMSLALKEEVVSLGIGPEKVNVIHMGIDVQRFSPSLRNKALLKDFGMAVKPVVISTRNLEPVYDVETLIKAIPLVLQEIPGAMFLIGGKGRQRAHLEDLARTLGISRSVKFVGWIPDKEFPSYLASSDLYVSTSLSDGTSVSLLEALSSELASVVTDIPANRPWVSDGNNGFLVPVRDHKMLAERIIFLLKDSETRGRFGKIGRNAIVERANYEKQMSKVATIYEELRHTKS